MFRTERETAVWLLNLANDMRARKGYKQLTRLPESVPQDSQRCIIANAFNFGCSVDPDEGIITFQNTEDRNTYLNVMNIDLEKDYEHDLELLDYLGDSQAPMTEELMEIAEAFDNHEMFSEYIADTGVKC